MSEDLKKQIHELSSLMKSDPDSVQKKLLKEGQNTIALFQDENFSLSLLNYRDLLKSLYLEVLLDLANGAPLLKAHTLGLVFRQGKFARFAVPHEDAGSVGTVVTSVNLKVRKAFERFRKEDEANISQDELNASVYYIIHQYSKL